MKQKTSSVGGMRAFRRGPFQGEPLGVSACRRIGLWPRDVDRARGVAGTRSRASGVARPKENRWASRRVGV
jgi:hypothetical protein